MCCVYIELLRFWRQSSLKRTEPTVRRGIREPGIPISREKNFFLMKSPGACRGATRRCPSNENSFFPYENTIWSNCCHLHTRIYTNKNYLCSARSRYASASIPIPTIDRSLSCFLRTVFEDPFWTWNSSSARSRKSTLNSTALDELTKGQKRYK